MTLRPLLCFLCLVAPVLADEAQIPKPDPARDKTAYEQAATGDWQKVFSDPCTGDWRKQWFLDGEVGTVTSGPEGMTLNAGPEFKNDAHHMVLWTKLSFEGDLKIDYDYTRTDNETRCVNILYIQAAGSGKGPYARDISQWNALRKVRNPHFPALRSGPTAASGAARQKQIPSEASLGPGFRFQVSGFRFQVSGQKI